jgi:hypothetical protein
MSSADPSVARDANRALADTLAQIRDATWGLGLAGDLSRVQNSVRDLAASRAVARWQRGAGRVPLLAAWLLAAARLLPAADRARYAEEYRSELWHLARSGAGPFRQLRYTLRQLLRILPTGFALRSARRTSAARLVPWSTQARRWSLTW